MTTGVYYVIIQLKVKRKENNMTIEFSTTNNKKEKISNRAENLAKLMTSENISLVYDNVTTASAGMRFDPETNEVISKIITFPTWLSEGTPLTDMITAHEVSHLLHTPYTDKSNKEYKSNALKITEDHRVDIRIKMKYPGFKSD